MCTAVSYSTENHYFGRNLDFDTSFGEQIVINGRRFPFAFRKADILSRHFAIIGMGIVSNNFPLYFDGANEKGLSMAGLLFKDLAHFHSPAEGKTNIASFELIPWVLSQCENLEEAKKLLQNTNVTDENFSQEYPSTPLHWIVADKSGSIVLESVEEGLKIYDNPTGVLTNSPEFPSHISLLESYKKGAVSLPDPTTSEARFIRAALTRLNLPIEADEQNCVNQFFHILGNVYRTHGSARKDEAQNTKTHYSSCINTDKGIYYYTTYENSSLNAVNMYEQELDTERVYTFPLVRQWRVNFQR